MSLRAASYPPDLSRGSLNLCFGDRDKMQLRMVDAPNASNSFPRLQEPLIRSVDPAV